MNLNDAEKMAKEYVIQVYPGLNPNSSQFKESEQHFLMGIWAMLQLTLNPKFDNDKAKTLESEIRSFQIKRNQELNRF